MLMCVEKRAGLHSITWVFYHSRKGILEENTLLFPQFFLKEESMNRSNVRTEILTYEDIPLIVVEPS